jgi:hypothetical protein
MDAEPVNESARDPSPAPPPPIDFFMPPQRHRQAAAAEKHAEPDLNAEVPWQVENVGF